MTTTVFHLSLNDLACAQYPLTVSNRFEVLSIPEHHVKLWDTFNREILQADKEYIGERPRSRSSFASVETEGNIEASSSARLILGSVGSR